MRIGPLLMLTLVACAPEMSSMDNTPVDTASDPVQEELAAPREVRVETDGGFIALPLVASYRIGGLVLGHRNVSLDYDMSVITTCVGMAWGKMAERDVQSTIDWGFGEQGETAGILFELLPESTLRPDYVLSHCSITGIIPANERVDKAARSLNYGDITELSGYLVEGSSLRRDDTGPTAGEIMYLQKVRVNHMVFE